MFINARKYMRHNLCIFNRNKKNNFFLKKTFIFGLKIDIMVWIPNAYAVSVALLIMDIIHKKFRRSILNESQVRLPFQRRQRKNA